MLTLMLTTRAAREKGKAQKNSSEIATDITTRVLGQGRHLPITCPECLCLFSAYITGTTYMYIVVYSSICCNHYGNQ